MSKIAKRNWTVVACAARVLLGHEYGCGVGRNDTGKIKRNRVMTSANTFILSTFGFIENGKQVGFDVDLATEIAKRMT